VCFFTALTATSHLYNLTPKNVDFSCELGGIYKCISKYIFEGTAEKAPPKNLIKDGKPLALEYN
jgi:hypothetical protein